MDYNLLADEISTDPTNAGYATMSDAEIAAALSAAVIRIRQRVTVERLQATAMEISVYVALRTAIATPETPPALLALCQSALDLVNARFDDIDLDNPAAQTMFGALRQYGIINAQQAAAIDALATARIISRAEQIRVGLTVSEQDVQRSRIVPQLDALRERLANGYNLAVATLDMSWSVPNWADLIAVIEAA